MITARLAAEYGRKVFAVPGRVDLKSIAGCLSLIRDGATMVTCVDDILDDLPYLNPRPIQGELPIDEIKCPVGRKVSEVLFGQRAAATDSLTEKCEVPVGRVMQSINLLEMHGMTKRRYDGLFELECRGQPLKCAAE
jgi:DNA processing protein